MTKHHPLRSTVHFTFVTLLIAVTAVATSAKSTDELLTPHEWQRIDNSVDRSLRWLATQQQPDGSFATRPDGQPGVSSLCVMAFVSHGHMPGEGPYGAQLQKAIDFIIRCQKNHGLLALVMPPGQRISRNVDHNTGSTTAYNHALSGLLLSEVFAMGGGNQKASQEAIEKAIAATLTMQKWSKRRRDDRGGWRYINRFRDGYDSDLSVTGWHLMFLRSSKNAGFEVPKEPIDDAVAYVKRCFQPKFNTFMINASPADRRSRGMAGAGILALAHAGLHDSPEARAAGDWLLQEKFARYNESRIYGDGRANDDRYHYGVFCASQAMYQLGDAHWQKFYPPTVRVILNSQNAQGFWAPDAHYLDGPFGSAYTTALMTLTLATPNQLLPIFQR